MCITKTFVYDCTHKHLVRLSCHKRNPLLCSDLVNTRERRYYDCCCCIEYHLSVQEEGRTKRRKQEGESGKESSGGGATASDEDEDSEGENEGREKESAAIEEAGDEHDEKNIQGWLASVDLSDSDSNRDRESSPGMHVSGVLPSIERDTNSHFDHHPTPEDEDTIMEDGENPDESAKSAEKLPVLVNPFESMMRQKVKGPEKKITVAVDGVLVEKETEGSLEGMPGGGFRD